MRAASPTTYGYKHSNETIEKIKKGNRGRQFSDEHKKKLSAAKIGKVSPRKGVTLTEETKHKISVSKTGNCPKTLSQEHKQKIREGLKKRMNEQKLSKKERRAQRRQKQTQEEVSFKKILDIKRFDPLTRNQAITYDSFAEGKNLMLHGVAGAGKTFLAMYLSLDEILSEFNQYDKLIIVRSVVPTRDMGFLPGKQNEKAEVYEAPYASICTELFGRGDAYQYLKMKNVIHFTTTSFIRGITLSNAIIIIDEMQNMTAAELNSVITRIGKNCRVIFCGDIAQTDLLNTRKEKTGLGDFVKIIHAMDCFEFIEFEEKDIVRSGLVRDYIITRTKLERNGAIERLTTL